MRTSPLDFVDGISTWIDYFAIDVCRKYGASMRVGSLRSGTIFIASSIELYVGECDRGRLD